MNSFCDVLQYRALLHVPRMANHDYVRDPKKAPGMDASDLKCIELRRLGLFQDPNCCAANGSTAPGSPRSALNCATDKNEIPAISPNLPIQIVAIQVRNRLPASTESFFLGPDRSGNESIGLHQNRPNFQMAQHLVNLQGLGRSERPLTALDATQLNRCRQTVQLRLPGGREAFLSHSK